MEWRDWIALGQLVAFVAVGIYFARRLERLRQLYAKNLKRYDLLHTARFKALEDADDRLVEVQQAQFDAWRAMQGRSTGAVPRNGDAVARIDRLSQTVYAATLAKIKCEKFFDAGFNEEFRALIGQLQLTELYIRDVWKLPRYENAAQLERGTRDMMEEAYLKAKEAIPAFRKRMGEIIQRDVG